MKVALTLITFLAILLPVVATAQVTVEDSTVLPRMLNDMTYIRWGTSVVQFGTRSSVTRGVELSAGIGAHVPITSVLLSARIGSGSASTGGEVTAQYYPTWLPFQKYSTKLVSFGMVYQYRTHDHAEWMSIGPFLSLDWLLVNDIGETTGMTFQAGWINTYGEKDVGDIRPTYFARVAISLWGVVFP